MTPQLLLPLRSKGFRQRTLPVALAAFTLLGFVLYGLISHGIPALQKAAQKKMEKNTTPTYEEMVVEVGSSIKWETGTDKVWSIMISSSGVFPTTIDNEIHFAYTVFEKYAPPHARILSTTPMSVGKYLYSAMWINYEIPSTQ